MGRPAVGNFAAPIQTERVNGFETHLFTSLTSKWV